MRKLTLVAALVASALGTNAMAGEVEVLHWWTSGGEAKAAAELKGLMEGDGHTWKDFAVSGGGGESAMTVLKSRAMAGNPPAAAQIKGPQIQDWAEMGFVGNIDDVAKAEGWDQVLPSVVSDVMKYEGHYVAAPVNVHRVNWLWANPAVFAQVGAEVPTSWDEFFAAADKLQAAGIIPLAHGGQAWQEATLFESVALGVGGADFYRKAFVELDTDTLTGPAMIKSLETFKKLGQYIDRGAPGRDWNLATAMVIEGKAAMQLMGDWAKGEFAAAGLTPGKDYVCVAAPGTADSFTFNVDSFVMFDVTAKDKISAQNDLAKNILSPGFQEVFNLNKGSIPVRSDVAMNSFDDCAKQSMNDFKATAQQGSLVPSWAHQMAMNMDVMGGFYDVLTQYFNSDSTSAEEAAKRLARQAKLAY